MERRPGGLRAVFVRCGRAIRYNKCYARPCYARPYPSRLHEQFSVCPGNRFLRFAVPGGEFVVRIVITASINN